MHQNSSARSSPSLHTSHGTSGQWYSDPSSVSTTPCASGTPTQRCQHFGGLPTMYSFCSPPSPCSSTGNSRCSLAMASSGVWVSDVTFTQAHSDT
jgi:hypothetical protein